MESLHIITIARPLKDNKHSRKTPPLAGFASMVVPVYLSEVSPVHLRGRITVVNNIFITGGQVVSSIVAGAFSEVKMGWRLAAQLCIYSAFFFLQCNSTSIQYPPNE